ncbi:MAG: hypothetical protein K0R17_3292 [Rariglobus sp.]|jgi:hypothetical protein|nr:hypothetical protein [Rariglobus sp.]
MSTTHFIALFLIVCATGAGMIVSTLSPRLRDVMFFMMVVGAALTTKLDVNFFSLEWYRGTTRGVEMTGVDILAMSLLAGCVLNPRYKDSSRIFWPAGLGLLVLYALYCTFSMATSHPKIFGLFELTKVLRGILVFVTAALFVRTRRELAILVFALACAVCLDGATALKQRYMDGMHRVEGTVEDPNSLSMYMCMVSPLFVAAAMANFPRWLQMLCWVSAAAGGLTVLLTISRAGVPIFGMVMMGAALFTVSWKITLKKVIVCALISMMAVVAVYKAWDMLMSRYEQATLEEEYMNKQNEGRGVYFRWAGAIMEDHFWGVGLNNWSWWVSAVYGPRAGFPYRNYEASGMSAGDLDDPSAFYAAPAHNLMALTAGELGVPGVIIFAFVWLRWFWMGGLFLLRRSTDPMLRLGIGLFFCTCGIFLQSVTEWTYRQTPIFITFHILAGVLASLHYHRKKEAKRLRENAEGQGMDDDGVVELEPETPAMAREWR